MRITQFGGLKGGSTDIPHHLIKSAIEYAALFNLSIFVLFLDLEKAFDRVLRELVFGFPLHVENTDVSQHAYLRSMGIDEATTEWVIHYLGSKGPIFLQWGVDEKVIQLINALHSNSWFQYGDLDSCIVAKTGGRQGCKLGGIIFNSVYNEALNEVTDLLLKEQIVHSVTKPGHLPFWCSDDRPSGREDVLDATFVDDHAMVLMASNARQLDRAIDIALSHLVNVFAKYLLVINWAPGKSEAMLKYRGHDSTSCYKNRIHNAKASIKLPSACGTQRLMIVAKYQHVGSVTTMCGSQIPDANLRASSAMGAYAPLSCKIFGSQHIAPYLKWLLLDSLVMSRLMYNTQCWHKCTRSMSIINSVYMRALRRIAGLMRFGADGNITDFEVRSNLVKPSIDCLLMRKRLLYAARIQKCKSQSLSALLSQKNKTKSCAWTVLINQDLEYVYCNLSDCVCDAAGIVQIGSPHSAPLVWEKLILGPKWREIVAQVFFINSILDERSSGEEHPLHFVCEICREKSPETKHAFASKRALESHSRGKHGHRNNIRLYIDDSNKCPSCSSIYGSRLSLLAHLSDARRPMCREYVLQHCEPLSASFVAKLDEADNEMRKAARKSGRSHHISVQPTINANGHQVGRLNF